MDRHSHPDVIGFEPPQPEALERAFSPRSDAKAHAPRPIQQAVVMAGGKGTRLYPYSAHFPKPLIPLGDMPILELLLRRLKFAGVADIVLAVGHLRHLIEAYFGDGASLGVNIRYKGEDYPLGTAGALGAIVDELDGDFFVTNGDLLTTLDLDGMVRQHRETGADASVGVFQRNVKHEFGLVEVDGERRMIAYYEKPQDSYLISMGIYILNANAVRPHLQANEHLDMPQLLLRMQMAGKDIRCFQDDCVWLDIGRPDDFALAQKMFEKDRQLFLGSS
ncbi:sugar phosphate nucleotidyltransferase [Methylocystis sp. MJC1]|uniref:sugar phosphate nucleotidyltransferase n=1 Tax=Methylocystis sp. MJC1 TaxID=2654282 RepID=UPI001FEE3893|nr:sugar phosphate nucleotidyltransferase [Methylocystis sp. MJC1]KAF2989734.1 D-glycero-alpha-D-manno-heptose 1-phosphate guanylyltransferase [Methylocystis sp. MJC1]UZX12824.1 sugar phosphate nucleotidyltransferase [Methylocystis sp. MJC1]